MMNVVADSGVEYRLEWLTYTQAKLLKELIDHSNKRLTPAALAAVAPDDQIVQNINRLNRWLHLLDSDGVAVGTIEEKQGTYRFRPAMEGQPVPERLMKFLNGLAG